LNRFGVIATNVVTALVTATLTSLFWMAATAHGPIVRAAGPSAAASTPGHVQLVSAGPPIVTPSGLAIPVSGVKPEQLVDTFDDARSGGRVHDAIDIMAAAGTPVVAAAPGRLEKLFFSKGGGGITAYVRSDDGRWMYYYAHLQNYAPGLHEGQAIRRGDLIGNVGSTGDASPQAPHLHFAIMQMGEGERWWQGTAINPYPLLAGKPGAR